MTTLIVLAAGLATRYGGAKQLEPVGPQGATLLDYALFDARLAGCSRVIFVIRDALRDSFEQSVLPRWSDRLEISLAVQRLEDAPARFVAGRKKPWGTAQALLAAAPLAAGDVLVCNADDFYGRGAYQALAASVQQPGGANAVAGYPLAQTLSPHGGVSRAVCGRANGGRLTRIEERTGIVRAGAEIVDDRGERLSPAELVSMNLWAFHAAFLSELAPAFAAFLERHGTEPATELRIPDVVNEYVANGRGEVLVVPVTERWFGMTYPADREVVRGEIAARIRRGEYPTDLRDAP